MRRVALLGSTGSIGTQTLQVAASHPDEVSVSALAAGRNVDLLIQQAKDFHPQVVSVARSEDEARVREALSDLSIEVRSGAAGLRAVAEAEADLVIGALVGSVGLDPVLAALACGRDVALANKEVLVMAGPLVLSCARAHGARLVPLDSEHVAIHKCLAGHPTDGVARLWLTASGGPFRTWSPERIRAATREEALAHPNWDMGPKITIDSATLMNKGFEVIEARWLFDVPAPQISVVIHPESVIHSLVEYIDGCWLAQLSVPDMRIPIAYVLGMPSRFALPELPPLDLVSVGQLHFEAPDFERFPALRVALAAAAEGGTAPAALNAANEVAVAAFLAGRIAFTRIAETVDAVVGEVPVRPGLDLSEIREVDRLARQHATARIEER
ncbi:MAG: 1-deoxy-D-xylulose-5-phosphate reductoisomerase [Myxococcota bacterium]